MDEAMAALPLPLRVNVSNAGINDNVLHAVFEPADDMADAPSDLYILPFGTSLERNKSPQIMLRAWATQAALADARGEDPRRLLVFSQNGQGSRAFNLTTEEKRRISSADEKGDFNLYPITDRIAGVVETYGDGELGTIAGHSLGAELGLHYALGGYGEVSRLMLSGSVRHANRRPITQLLMQDFAKSSPRFSQQILETDIPVLMDHYGVTPKKLPKTPPGSARYVIQAATTSNLALRNWLANDGFNEDLVVVLDANPGTAAWVEQGDCSLERPQPPSDEAEAHLLMQRYNGRLLYEFSPDDHGRADSVPQYARKLFEKTVELADAA